MKQKTLIIDNNISTCNKLEKLMISKMPGTELIGSFTNVNEGIQQIESRKPKLIFVNLQNLTAENFLRLQQMGNTGFTIIFITKETIEKQISIIPPSFLNEQNKKSIRFKFRDGNDIIEYDDNEIVRIEAHSNYSKVYVADRLRPFIIARTLKHFSEKLKNSTFIRPHQTHLINQQFVRNYKNKQLVLSDDTLIPVSRRKQQEIKTLF